MSENFSISRRLAPEDIRPGLFVVVLCRAHEVMLPMCDALPSEGVRVARVVCIECADGDPRRVVAVCLPFVQVEAADGSRSVLDTRVSTLAAVSEDYALEEFTRPRRQDDD